MTSLLLVLFLSADVPQPLISCEATNDLIRTLDIDPWMNKKQNRRQKERLESRIRRTGPRNCDVTL